MKYLSVFILMIAALPLTAEDRVNRVMMKDFDLEQLGFSFSEGGLVDFNARKGCPLNVDFIFDNDLGMNNKELAGFFSGTGEIVDLGFIELDEKTAIPESGFKMSVDVEDLIPGHVYLIRTADGLGYGRILITYLSKEKDTLGFNWVSLN